MSHCQSEETHHGHSLNSFSCTPSPLDNLLSRSHWKKEVSLNAIVNASSKNPIGLLGNFSHFVKQGDQVVSICQGFPSKNLAPGIQKRSIIVII